MRLRGERKPTTERQTEVANYAIQTARPLRVEGFDRVVATGNIVDLAADKGTTLAGLYRPDVSGNPINSYEELVTMTHTLPITTEVIFNGRNGLVIGVNDLTFDVSGSLSLEEKIASNIELTPLEISYVLGKLALDN